MCRQEARIPCISEEEEEEDEEGLPNRHLLKNSRVTSSNKPQSSVSCLLPKAGYS